MAEPSLRKRIWGWFFFDWASQPYHTLLVTFIFGPYFAAIATQYFTGTGLEEQAADARAQTLWSVGLTVSGLIVGFGGPILGAFADTTGRRMPWIVFFSMLYIAGASSLWWVLPDGSNLWFALVAFGIGFIGAEYALIFTNAQLPGLGTRDEIGKISGSGFAFGYLGGVTALIITLLLLVEQSNGKTIAGLDPPFGLDASAREGTRAVGPFVALWFAVFMIPYFLWVRETRQIAERGTFGDAIRSLGHSIRSLRNRPSLASFLGGSMLYRDALNGFYGFGGTYAVLVLDWEVTQVGVFGIISAMAAVILSFIGGRLDQRLGPKPVIIACILILCCVCLTVASMDRQAVFGMPIEEGSNLPDLIFMGCGVLIGGLGGILQAASRSLMVRHTDTDSATEAFGLYGLAGRATSFLAPALIGTFTVLTGSARLGILPVLALFILGLVLLRWTNPEGDRSS